MIPTKISKTNFIKIRRFSGTVRLPNIPRPRIKICVIADANHMDKCKALGYDFIDAEALKKKIDPTDKKGKELKKWSANFKLFFVSDTLVRQLPKLGGPLLTKWGKFPTVISQLDDLGVKIEEGTYILLK